MPLLDHARLPRGARRQWQSLHSAWANAIVRQLNQGILPERYVAVPMTKRGVEVEIDMATYEVIGSETPSGGVATTVWSPPRPLLAAPVDFTGLDLFEVQIFDEEIGGQLVAAVELVSPGNKDRPSTRLAFASKCASFLQQGVGLLVVDIVAERTANLHGELMQLLGLADPFLWQSPTKLYAVSYRPVSSERQFQLEMWPEALTIGAQLPTMPLWLGQAFVLPLELESSYLDACATIRIRAGNGVSPPLKSSTPDPVPQSPSGPPTPPSQ